MTATATDVQYAGPLDKERAKLRQLLGAIDLGEPMRRRAVQQAISEASAWYWAWRAEQFHAAAPKPSDFNGQATAQELADATERCLCAARACWSHAHLLAEMEVSDD
jgi:hypothetical protein